MKLHKSHRRRFGGRLRRWTGLDRQRKAARNERRGRKPKAAVA